MLARRLVQHYMSTLIQNDENILQHVWWYTLYASNSIYPFGDDWESARYLAGVKHLTKSRIHHRFLEAYHFRYWVVHPL
jgi:hypothetical protein